MTTEAPFMRALYGFGMDAAPFQNKSPEEIADLLVSWGVNAVFIKNDSIEMIPTLREKGIQCYQSIGMFQGKRHWESHPQSRPIQADGTLLEQDRWYCGVCPNQAWLQEAKMEELQKMLRAKDLDGVWLDSIRYPVHWEVHEPRIPQTCFCPVCLEKFSTALGIEIPEEDVGTYILTHHAEEWYRWRTEQITDIVARMRQVIETEKPGTKLGIFSVPWFRGERDDAIWKVVAQDFTALSEHVDYFSPMVYHRMCNEPVEWISESVRKMYQETGKRVYPIIQGCNEPGIMSQEEFQGAIRAAEVKESQGVIIFTLDHVLRENRLESLLEVWQDPPRLN